MSSKLFHLPGVMAPKRAFTHIHQTAEAEALHNFAVFPKLPIELRLKIWRSSFATGHHVSLPFIKPYYGQLPLEDRSTFPNAFRVNHESRTEALKHYFIVLLGRSKKPFVYSPKFDIIWIGLFFSNPGTKAMDTLASNLQVQAPKIFSQTKIIEVRHWDWSCGILKSTRLNRDRQIGIQGPATHGPTETQMKPFLDFPNLEVVRLIVDRNYRAYHMRALRTLNPAQINAWIQGFRQWLEEHKVAFTKGAPIVVMEKSEAEMAAMRRRYVSD